MSEQELPRFHPALKNELMRRTAFACLLFTAVITVHAYLSGGTVPTGVYELTTVIVTGWMGFSKWGEIRAT